MSSTVEGENYDVGGEGVSYHDTTPTNTLGVYRTGANEGVDVEQMCGSTCKDIADVVAGEWTEYTVKVTTAGMYKVTLGVSATVTNHFHIEVDGTNVTGSLAIAPTAGFQSVVETVVFPLTTGQKVLRFVFEDDGLKLNWVKFLLQ
jgi:Carbohydrate binding module (family 35)